ncbi:type II toxin-antitoxin system RelE/ParE family toxin [Candidatus Sumerlaeota bacterium]|nr:type II toxin-antitoxin system RelE/ParE family toxin [Candidatus Sumerlaeota bacterium]
MYNINFTPQGFKSLESLDREIAQRILDKLKWFIEHIDEIRGMPLSGEFTGLYKLRMGDWRIIYSIDHKERLITIHKTGHRKDIYK